MRDEDNEYVEELDRRIAEHLSPFRDRSVADEIVNKYGAASAASFFAKRGWDNIVDGVSALAMVRDHLYPETVQASAQMARHLAKFFAEAADKLDEELVMRGLK